MEDGLTSEDAPTAPTRTPDVAERPARAAAFFDLDRTLIAGASTFAVGIAAFREGMLSPRQLLSDGANALVFRLTGGSDERTTATRDRILQGVADHRVEDLAALGEYVVPRLLEKVRPEARALLDMHGEAGRDRYIVSASPIEIIEQLSTSLGLEGAIGTRSQVLDGVYTGELEGPFVYGPGKAEAVRELATDQGYDLRLSYAYSDSSSDLPMLELVGHPVAVNPDRSLEAVAHRRGWPIVIFRRRAKRVVKATTASTSAVGLAIGTYALGRRHGRVAAEAEQGRLVGALRR